MRRSPFAAAVAALSLFVPATAGAGAPTMQLGEVRPGMACTALTVIAGIEPVPFDGTVISVEGSTPDSALIIMRFSGAAVAAGGIAQGFSGSPVSCPDAAGTPRVIGAIAYGVGQYDNLVAGVTPIEAMLSMPTLGWPAKTPSIGKPAGGNAKRAKADAEKSKRAAKTSKRAVGRTSAAKALGTTGGRMATRPALQLSGVRGPLLARLSQAAQEAGRTLLAGPASGGTPVAIGGTLKAGDAVAATAVTGDIAVSSIGTVSYVDGNRVWAFGHPASGGGAARLLLQRASISTIIDSPTIGDQGSFKVGTPVQTVGTLGFDGSFGIGGELGRAPKTLPLRVTVKEPGGRVLGRAEAQIADEREVRGGTTTELLELAAGSNAAGLLQRTARADVVGGSARVCTTISLHGEQVPLYQCSDAIATAPLGSEAGLETGVLDAVARAVAPVTSAERFTRLVEGVSVEVTLRDEADTLEIQQLRAPRTARAGTKVKARVTVVLGSGGERRDVAVRIAIPRSAAGQTVALGVTAASRAVEGDGDLDFEELFDEEESAPRSLPLLRSGYTDEGLSALRAIVLPGRSARAAERLLNGSEDSEDDGEGEQLARLPLVRELPGFAATGVAATTLRVTR